MEEDTKKLEPSFSSLVMSMATSTILKMGLDPSSKDEKNLEMARYNIDLLEIIKDKTENNLTPEESKLIKDCLKDLKLHFIQVNKETSKSK